jgi:hypothetical protein
MSLLWILRRFANVSPFFNSPSNRLRITNEFQSWSVTYDYTFSFQKSSQCDLIYLGRELSLRKICRKMSNIFVVIFWKWAQILTAATWQFWIFGHFEIVRAVTNPLVYPRQEYFKEFNGKNCIQIRLNFKNRLWRVCGHSPQMLGKIF